MKKKIPEFNDPLIVLYEWLRSTDVMHRGHHYAANYFQRWHRWLGITSTVFNATVASAIFIYLTSEDSSDPSSPKSMAIIIGGVVSLFATIITGIITFVRYDEISLNHFKAATKFQAVRRMIEEKIGFMSKGLEEGESFCTIRSKWTEALENAIPMTQWIYRKFS